MLRKIVSVWIVMLCCLSLCGCADHEQQTASQAEQTKTASEYKAEADEQITEENVSDELDKLEEEIDQEAAQQP